MEGARVLDCFAGSGAFGLEAISRGASFVTFIDKDTSCAQANAAMAPRASFELIRGDFLKAAPRLSTSYDIVFIDPPYGVYPTEQILSALPALLAPGAAVLYEEFYKTVFTPAEGFTLTDERKYGDTIIRFLEYSS